ncbi:uncharacterized protein PRCAT00003305001 [Priceomyces carsonii]|uniref:uncharacterized protein n=1 Tax=Priceomyces carsonii TaxID=28549 RepID=UPI002EDB9C12|nr:unnamed protein product [Priceomyces carsonii]
MEGWLEVCRIPPLGANGGEHGRTTALEFDGTQNLLWCGDSLGLTRSFTTQNDTLGFQPFQLCPYSKFPVSENKPVRQHLSHREGLFSLLQSSLIFNNRRGIVKQEFSWELFKNGSEQFRNLSCMAINSNANNDIIVGSDDSFMKIDVNKPNNLINYDYTGSVSFVKTAAKFLVLGKTEGTVDIFDPLSQTTVKTFPGHSSSLSDLDIQGNYIATCGYSSRARSFHPSKDFMADLLVNIYDLRMLKALAPIPFPAGASCVRFHPKLPNILVIASRSGQIQLVDMFDQLLGYLYQANLAVSNTPLHVNNSYLSNLEISGNGEFISFNDSCSNLHLWSYNPTGKDFVSFPSPLEQPDIILPLSTEFLSIDDNVPLSSVGMPYYKDLLLSNFASDLRFTKELAKLPKKIITPLTMDSQERVFPYDELKYGPMYFYNRYASLKEGNARSVNIPKFISERTNDLKSTPSIKSNNSTDSGFDGHENDSIFQFKVAPPADYLSKGGDLRRTPNCYSKLSIHYSRFGVEDFDFDYYNKSNGMYCGLENHLDNSYINPLIQLYRYNPMFYNLVILKLKNEWLPCDGSTIMRNPNGSSILNELGYLFDMMFKAQGKNVTISNFSETLNTNVSAVQEGLIDTEEGRKFNAQQLRLLICKFNAFLMFQLNSDLLGQFNDSSLDNVMGLQYELEVKSSYCHINEKQVGKQFVIDLITPPETQIVESNTGRYSRDRIFNRRRAYSIVDYLDYSLNQVKAVPCKAHNFAHPLSVESKINSLPPLLSVNVNFTKEEFDMVSSYENWLVPSFYATRDNGNLSFKQSGPQNSSNSIKYELQGFVCEINHSAEDSIDSHNLVSFVKINGQWFLFNDFLVMPILDSEVFNLLYPWKKPIIILYSDIDHPLNQCFDYFTNNRFKSVGIDDQILYKDHFAGSIRDSYRKEYELLSKEEAPSAGTLVAIDAEFVTLRPEILEIYSDGRKNIIKPKKLSLARVSALRGDNGTKEGVPFIDDYIVHTSEISDYLTNFSGIEPGDLDPIKSDKNLVTLQTAYRRLWLLLNLGVIFVGHGLKNDFRCINLQVPPSQIRDTAEFFYKSDFKRKLSLKFLVYILLKEKVQTGNHDSIEDANSALLLYKKYVELKAIGEFEATLNNIYFEGQQLRFRVPES